jgi:O-acetylhomoserine/O-acetylserine sulfhydrylase-like pyridoxal-dependent enzyme
MAAPPEASRPDAAGGDPAAAAPGPVRYSAGIEDAADLLADLRQALECD